MARRTKRLGWRRGFLRALARTANVKLSAAMAGVDHTTAYQLRERDPVFAAAWLRARDWGRARVKAEGRPVHANGRPRAARPGEALDPRELVIRTSNNGGTQIVRAGEGRWSPSAEGDFFAHLAAGFGVRRSAAAVGFSAVAVYKRRKSDPGFRAQWDAAKAEGLERNDMLLIDSVPRALDPAIEAADELPKPTIAEAIQIVRLYRPAKDGGRRGGVARREPSIEEVRASILWKLDSIEAHEKKESEGQGES